MSLEAFARSRSRRAPIGAREAKVHERTRAAILRTSRSTLRRMCAAYGLEWTDFTISAETSEPGVVEVGLTYEPRGCTEPFDQRRQFYALLNSEKRICDKAREHVISMAWNVALLHCPASVGPPTGWSIHPAAASIVTTAGTALPNPADPRSWMARTPGRIHLPDGGGITDAVFSGREGVLLLDQASIADSHGRKLADVVRNGPRMSVLVMGVFPESVTASLAGRPAETLCSAFAAPDERAAQIASAVNAPSSSSMIVELVDRLVPLLPTVRGAENWRPRRARRVVEAPAEPLFRRVFGPPARAIASRYSASPAGLPQNSSVSADRSGPTATRHRAAAPPAQAADDCSWRDVSTAPGKPRSGSS